MNTSNNNLYEIIKEKLSDLRTFIARHLVIILPVGVLLIVAIVLIVSISAHNARNNETEDVPAPKTEAIEPEGQLGSDTVIMAVPEVALEENAYPEVNDLINRYYTAMAAGDIDTVKSINNNIDDTDAIRIVETAKYIDKYDSVKVYTKLGPVEGAYLVYVYSEMHFYDYDASVPGLEAFYVCTDESGNLFINDGEESEAVINYIREATLQDDVVDLNNEVAVAYNNMLVEDDKLSLFLMDMTDSIDVAVGESLAQAEGSAVTKEDTGDSAEEQASEKPASDVTKEEVTTVKAVTVVNIRSSDSETADKLGKASEGQEFKLIEKKGNGWSEIDYNGKSAFIKSEFLEEVGTETIINVADSSSNDNSNANSDQNADNDSNSTTGNTDSSTQNKTASAGSDKVTGTVTVKDNVRIRSTASTDGEKIATVYMGEKLDLIEKMSNGWTKIKYKGQVAYVKSDYVE